MNFNPDADTRGNPDPCLYTGTVVFWQKSSKTKGIISIENQRGIIDTLLQDPPPCGFARCATFTLLPGTYEYTADFGGLGLTGNVTVTARECARHRVL